MKIKLEVDCTPAEARSFLGLPDMTGLNARLTAEIQARIEANMAAMKPEEMVKAWTAFGGQAQEQFRKLMTAAADAAMPDRHRP